MIECQDQSGKLYLKAPLPGMGRRLTGEDGRSKFKEEYFNSKHPCTAYSLHTIINRCVSGNVG